MQLAPKSGRFRARLLLLGAKLVQLGVEGLHLSLKFVKCL
jgi:hypothetical protein